MAGSVRVTSGRRSHESGQPVGISLNTFGMEKLLAGVNGEALAAITLEAAQPMRDDLHDNWYGYWFKHDTGASQDSIGLVVTEVEARHARVQLQVGGEKLRNDAKNKNPGVDYAPFLEFHDGGGMLRNSFFDHQEETVRRIHAGVRALVDGLLA